MNRLSRDQRVQVLRCLVEGNSIRSTVRMTGVAKGTVLKLLEDMGGVCSAHQDDAQRNLTSKRVQCDEIWSFVGVKARNIPAARKGEPGIGDAWTWVAIDADTKLCITWALGDRSAAVAYDFMQSVASRLTNRVQLTTDGNRMYLTAVDFAFEGNVDYAMLVKKYGGPDDSSPERRYSPAVCTGADPQVITGKPNPAYVNTSFVERQNLTMRMSMRRFTRLTNAFSKKIDNLAYAVALHFSYYNWCRPHQSLKGQTPAMAAGLTDRVWTLDDLVERLERHESSQKSN